MCILLQKHAYLGVQQANSLQPGAKNVADTLLVGAPDVELSVKTCVKRGTDASIAGAAPGAGAGACASSLLASLLAQKLQQTSASVSFRRWSMLMAGSAAGLTHKPHHDANDVLNSVM